MGVRTKDVAVVLSGGGMSGVVMELGFLQRLRASPLWNRVGVVFGTSAGALAGCMAVLDRLDDLEQFLLRLRPEEAFRANRLWRLPLLGTHDYVLPRTVAERRSVSLRPSSTPAWASEHPSPELLRSSLATAACFGQQRHSR